MINAARKLRFLCFLCLPGVFPDPLHHTALASFETATKYMNEHRLPSETITLLHSAIGLAPSFAEAYANLALVQQSLGQSAAAFRAHATSIRLSPWCGACYDNRGLLHMKGNDLQAAVRDFSRAIELRPHDANVYGGSAFSASTHAPPVLHSHGKQGMACPCM